MQLKWWYAIFFENFKILYSHLGRREGLDLWLALYEGISKLFYTLFFKKIIIYITDIRRTLVLNIISFLLDTLNSAICMLLNDAARPVAIRQSTTS